MSISKSAIAATGIFVAVSLTPLTAVSQPRQPCVANLGIALSALEKEAHEFVLGSAINQYDHFTVFTVNPDTGDWSMLVTMPSGRVCLVHFGTEWQFAVSGDRT